jgi:hypothetical protein
VVPAERPRSVAPELYIEALQRLRGEAYGATLISELLTCYSNLYTDLEWIRVVEITFRTWSF